MKEQKSQTVSQFLLKLTSALIHWQRSSYSTEVQTSRLSVLLKFSTRTRVWSTKGQKSRTICRFPLKNTSALIQELSYLTKGQNSRLSIPPKFSTKTSGRLTKE